MSQLTCPECRSTECKLIVNFKEEDPAESKAIEEQFEYIKEQNEWWWSKTVEVEKISKRIQGALGECEKCATLFDLFVPAVVIRCPRSECSGTLSETQHRGELECAKCGRRYTLKPQNSL